MRDRDTLAPLRLNGEPLPLDHAFPARLIAPNRPGVLQTEWLSRIVRRQDAQTNPRALFTLLIGLDAVHDLVLVAAVLLVGAAVVLAEVCVLTAVAMPGQAVRR